MTLKTTISAVAAAVAFAASLMIAAAPGFAAAAKMRVFERSIHGSYDNNNSSSASNAIASHQTRPNFQKTLVTTSATASGRGGYWVRRFRARSRALAKWRIEAAKTAGPGATRWMLATGKHVTCSALRKEVRCTVSARPANPLQRLGLTSY